MLNIAIENGIINIDTIQKKIEMNERKKYYIKGVIDCPDLPLNVSRSALQNDGFVKKISDYITKKVADKLSGMCKTDKENYEKYWDDISPFIKYGCLKDEKFCEKMSDYVLFKNIDDKFLTFKECLEKNKEAHENTIFYTTDPVQQSQYKLSLGTKVTEVLNWVAEGSADAGIVYATDAASMTDKVSVVAEAPEGSVSKVIYPVAELKETKNKDAADVFMEFLQSDEALDVFKVAGFTVNSQQ